MDTPQIPHFMPGGLGGVGKMTDEEEAQQDFKVSKYHNEMDDELNRQQFEEENPYGHSQKLNMTDYHQRNHSNNSRGYKIRKTNSSKDKENRSRRHHHKTSPFEKHEAMKFTCYEL